MIDKRSQIRRIYALVIQKVMGKFFGEIYIKFEHGNIVFARIIENIKPLNEDVSEVVDQFLDREVFDDPTKFSGELILKKIGGSPHISKVKKGSLDQLVTEDIMEEASKHRHGSAAK